MSENKREKIRKEVCDLEWKQQVLNLLEHIVVLLEERDEVYQRVYDRIIQMREEEKKECKGEINEV